MQAYNLKAVFAYFVVFMGDASPHVRSIALEPLAFRGEVSSLLGYACGVSTLPLHEATEKGTVYTFFQWPLSNERNRCFVLSLL